MISGKKIVDNFLIESDYLYMKIIEILENTNDPNIIIQCSRELRANRKQVIETLKYTGGISKEEAKRKNINLSWSWPKGFKPGFLEKKEIKINTENDEKSKETETKEESS